MIKQIIFSPLTLYLIGMGFISLWRWDVALGLFCMSWACSWHASNNITIFLSKMIRANKSKFEGVRH